MPLPVRLKKTTTLIHLNEKDTNAETSEHCANCEGFAADCINIAMNIIFLVGSICFLERFGEKGIWLGVNLFIIGSVVQFCMALRLVIIFFATSDHEWNEYYELLENCNFLTAAALFAVGTTMFLPNLFDDDDAETWGEFIGAWCFILGSLGFVEANFWNTMTHSAQRGKLPPRDGTAEFVCARMTAAGLYLANFGAVLFTAGSFLYQPMNCTSVDSVSLLQKGFLHLPGSDSNSILFNLGSTLRRHSGRAARVDAMPQGTWCFIIGSICFLCQSLLKIWCTFVQRWDASEKPAMVHVSKLIGEVSEKEKDQPCLETVDTSIKALMQAVALARGSQNLRECDVKEVRDFLAGHLDALECRLIKKCAST